MAEKLCEYCNEMCTDVAQRRLNTLYHDDNSDNMYSCYDCFREQWNERDEDWESSGIPSPFGKLDEVENLDEQIHRI